MGRTLIATSLALSSFLLFSCGGGSQSEEGRSKAGDGYIYGGGKTVKIKDNYFDPMTVEIPAGDSVTWENTGVVAHNVTGSFASSHLVEPGEKFHHGFEKPGTYSYRCTLHPGMNGNVLVAPQQNGK